MKFSKPRLFVILSAFALVAGCAANHDHPSAPASAAGTSGTGAGTAPAVAVAAIPTSCGETTPPQGCYTTAQSGCSTCPTGYDVSGTGCVVSTSQPCAASEWNGFACNTPAGFGCPAGSSFSCLYGGCVAPSCTGAKGYLCITYQSAAVYYFVSGAPASGTYFNGFGWETFQSGAL